MITKKSLGIVEKITQKVPSFHHHYHILYDIANMIKKEKITYLEIGAYAGASAILMLHNEKVEKVFSIDIGKPVEKNTVLKNVSDFFKDDRYNYILGNSQKDKTINSILTKIKEVDILFIDGDHTFQGVIKDFKNYSPIVSKGGYIIFDDYNCNASKEVKVAVDHIIEKIDKKTFKIIGTLKNVYDAYPKDMKDGNCFILERII